MDPSTQKGHVAQYISDFTNDLCARYRNKLTKLGGITGLTCRATMRSPCTMCEDFVDSTVPDQGQGNICPVVFIPTKLSAISLPTIQYSLQQIISNMSSYPYLAWIKNVVHFILKDHHF